MRSDDEPQMVPMEDLIPGTESATSEEAATGAAPRNWDFLLSTFLILILIAQTALFITLGFSYGIQVFSCADQPGVCNIPAINWSARAVIFGTPVIALAAIVFAVVRLVRRRQAWWIPLAGMALSFAVYLIANWVVDQSVPG